MRRLERDSCPFLLILTLLFRFCLLDLILPVPFPALSLRAGFLTQLPFLPNRSDSVRPILALSDSVARLRFLPPDAGKGIFRTGRRFLGNPAGLSFPDSCFCPSRGGSPAAGHLGMLTQPITLMCTRRILRATHFAIEVRSALRTVQSLLNGGSSHVRQRSHGRWHGGARAVRGRS